MPVQRLHHVQLAMPEGGEPRAREFYQGLLGIPEVVKPEDLAARGGGWFEDGEVRVHLGVEADFRPACKAHPALIVSDLPALSARLSDAGYRCQAQPDFKGSPRVFVADPFGNRVELMGCTG
jgi:catechol 2,3-dioxygenase-like lactoylglutathione lyase family enzyme